MTSESKGAEGHAALAGHLGNLTPEQEQALETFRQDLTAAGLYTPAGEDRSASHDDATLLYGISSSLRFMS